MKKSIVLAFWVFLFTSVSAQSYDDMVQRSFGFIEARDYKNAEEALKSALRSEPANPQNALLLTNLGTVQRTLGKQQDALLSYSSALMLMPRSVSLLSSRAALYAEMDLLDKAEEDYTTILYIDDDHEESLYRRGLIRLEKGDTLASRYDFERILASNSTSWRGRLGTASLLKASGDFVMAAEMYSQVIRVNDKQSDLYLKRAEVYFLDNKLAKAIGDINKSIELDPEDPLAYIIRGRIRYAQYDKHSALKDFEKAREMGFDEPFLQELIKKSRK